MSFLLFLLVLGVLILSHEFGHFLVAKKNGIKVEEFAFGFPPRLFKFKKGETVYSINLIPFGGFVKIYGQDDSGKPESSQDPRSFASKSGLVKAGVLLAGVFFNLLLAWLLISLGLIVGLPTSVSSVPPQAEIKDVRIAIIDVARNSPAENAGLKAGDELIAFSTIEEFQNFIANNKGKEMEIRYQRGEEIFSAKLVPRISPPVGQGAIGVAMDMVGILKLPWYSASWEGLKMTCNLTISIAWTIFSFIASAFRGLVGLEGVMGPIGIVGATGTVAKLGFSYLLGFIALLSINLAILNIIPFPALDGGRLLFLLIEKIKGSPINPRFSSIVHGVGMALLLILMLAITYRDILRLM